MNVSITIPRFWVPEGVDNVRRWAIDTAISAAAAGIEPRTPPRSTDNHNLKAYLNRRQLAVLSRKPADAPMSAYIAGLVYASLQAQTAAPAGVAGGLRPEQRRLVEQAEAGIETGSIVYAEAGTGVGKSRAALVMAARYWGRTGRAAIIAAPTLVVVGQLIGEYEEVSAEDMGLSQKPALAAVIGRRSFVDPALLRDLVDNPGEIDRVAVDQARAWLEAGGPPVPGGKTANLHRVGATSWLVDDLQAAAPAFPATDAALSDARDDECPAAAMYRGLRERAQNASIIVCTHAMLGLDVMRRTRSPEELARRIRDLDAEMHAAAMGSRMLRLSKLSRERQRLDAMLRDLEGAEVDRSPSLLPDCGLLIIDEAHQLEASLAGLRTSDVNPRLMANAIRALSPTFAAQGIGGKMDRIADLLDALHRGMAGCRPRGQMPGGRVQVNGDRGDQVVLGAMRPHLEKLGRMDLSRLIKKSRAAAQFLSPLQTLIKTLDDDCGDAVWASFSPRLQFPSLHTGPRTVKPLLDRVWARAEAAVLMSATLALPDSTGRPRVAYLSRQLATPPSRVVTLMPIVQPWLYDPELSTPAVQDPALRMPDMREEDMNEVSAICAAWFDAVARHIVRIATDAVGGTLVLNSSYDRARLIGERLKNALGDRLVLQDRRRGLRAAQAEFEQKHRAGLRPVWLAAGAAWTGLDLRDTEASAEDDILLTDLVIPNLPFGTNRSNTHQTRMEYDRLVERDRCALEFKQGIGRLMRRAGVANRRLHVLDSRPWDPGKRGFYAPFRVILQPYRAAATRAVG